MSSITAANAVIILTVNTVFPVGQQLAGWAAEDIFDTEALDNAETMMGVDGILSAGFVFVPVKQNFALQADSPSNLIFDAWYTAQKTASELYSAQAVIHLPAVNRSYVMNNGYLTSYKPTPDAKKVLQPRKYQITWESIIPAPM